MRRGDIFFANLDPTIGTEIRKKRPVLIVSNNANNEYSNTITIIPLTSNVQKIFPFEVLLDKAETGLSKSSKAQCQQIRTISKLRLDGQCLAHIHANSSLMRSIDAALMLHLDI